MVSLTCVNRGGLPATTVTGSLLLPPNVVLENPADSLRRIFPSPMNPWKPGDSVPVMKWSVRYTKKFRMDTELQFRFVVGGLGPTGLPTDTAESSCSVRVPGLPPLLACELILPDSLRLNATRTNLEPNPFTVRYRIRNIGKQTTDVSTISLSWDMGDGLTLDPSTPPLRIINWTLLPADTLILSWTMNAQNRTYPRNAIFCVAATDDEGNVIHCCDTLPIAAYDPVLTCDAMSSDHVIRFDTATGAYAPDRWVITATIGNPGPLPLSNVTAEVVLCDSLMNDLVEFDPAFPDNTNPKSIAVLFSQASKPLQWGFRLRDANRTGQTIHSEFCIRYSAAGAPLYTAGCSVPVEVESVPGSRLDGWCEVPDTLRFDASSRQYVPNPFDVSVSIVNRGFMSARNAIATILLPAGTALADTGESATKALTPITLDHYAGGPAPTLTWRLRYLGLPMADTCFEVAFDISGIDSLTNSIIHATSSCVICMKAAQPSFRCDFELADSLRLNTAGDDLTRNPFRVRYRIRNVGVVAGVITSVVLSIPGGSDISCDPATPSTFLGKWTLAPGDTLTVTWFLRVVNRLTQRDVLLTATALDDTGSTMTCGRAFSIPAVTILNDASNPAAPEGYVLHQNIPNPFSSSTIIQFEIPAALHVRVTIQDALGRQVAVLVNDRRDAGRHNVHFDAGALPSGAYICRFEAGAVTMQQILSIVR